MSNDDDVTSAISPFDANIDGMERKRGQPSSDNDDDGKGAKRGRVEGGYFGRGNTCSDTRSNRSEPER